MVKEKSNNKMKFVVIAIIIALFAFVGIGYAIYTKVINIGGSGNVGGQTFNLEVSEVAETSGADLGTTTIGTDKLSVTIAVNATKPGDVYTSTITVKNKGSLSAKYKCITAGDTNTAATTYVTYSLTTTGTADSTVLAKDDTQVFTFTFSWSSTDTTEYEAAQTYNFSFTINYEQA